MIIKVSSTNAILSMPMTMQRRNNVLYIWLNNDDAEQFHALNGHVAVPLFDHVLDCIEQGRTCDIPSMHSLLTTAWDQANEVSAIDSAIDSHNKAIDELSENNITEHSNDAIRAHRSELSAARQLAARYPLFFNPNNAALTKLGTIAISFAATQLHEGKSTK